MCETRDMYFVVRCIGHKSREFRRGDALSIGSDASNDLVLNGHDVSGEHAFVHWDADQAFPLLEIKSSNGVEVNDEIHDEAVFLTDYSTLGIGDFAVIFQLKGMTKKMTRAPRKEPKTGKGGFRLFSGDTTRVEGMFKTPTGLHNALMFLEAKKRTGTLEIKAHSGAAQVVFGMGILITAELGDATGQSAVDAVLALQQGEFKFSADITPSEDNLGLSVKQLLDARG